MGRTIASARTAGCFPKVSNKQQTKAKAAAKKKEKERKRKEEKEKREKARQAQKEQKAPPDMPRNSKNHSKVVKGLRNVLEILKNNHVDLKTYTKPHDHYRCCSLELDEKTRRAARRAVCL